MVVRSLYRNRRRGGGGKTAHEIIVDVGDGGVMVAVAVCRRSNSKK